MISSCPYAQIPYALSINIVPTTIIQAENIFRAVCRADAAPDAGQDRWRDVVMAKPSERLQTGVPFSINPSNLRPFRLSMSAKAHIVASRARDAYIAPIKFYPSICATKRIFVSSGEKHTRRFCYARTVNFGFRVTKGHPAPPRPTPPRGVRRACR